MPSTAAPKRKYRQAEELEALASALSRTVLLGLLRHRYRSSRSKHNIPAKSRTSVRRPGRLLAPRPRHHVSGSEALLPHEDHANRRFHEEVAHAKSTANLFTPAEFLLSDCATEPPSPDDASAPVGVLQDLSCEASACGMPVNDAHQRSSINFAEPSKHNIMRGRHFLTIQLGRHKTQASVLALVGCNAEEKASVIALGFGSDDLDEHMILDHFEKEIVDQFGTQVSRCALVRLKAACKRAKRVLASSPEARIKLDMLVGDCDFNSTITRGQLHELNLKRCLYLAETALKEASVEKGDIDEVIMVVEAAGVPTDSHVNMLKEFFTGTGDLKPMKLELLYASSGPDTLSLRKLEMGVLIVGCEFYGGVITKIMKVAKVLE